MPIHQVLSAIVSHRSSSPIGPHPKKVPDTTRFLKAETILGEVAQLDAIKIRTMKDGFLLRGCLPMIYN
jgi:hypothetical protein